MTFEKIIKKASLNNHKRNRHARIEPASKKNLVFQMILKNKLKPKTILEIGSSTGYLLESLRTNLNSQCFGIDTSKSAISEYSTDEPAKRVSSLDSDSNFKSNTAGTVSSASISCEESGCSNKISCAVSNRVIESFGERSKE